jgi:cytoskeletal protein CcmA (bactofilin family)
VTVRGCVRGSIRARKLHLCAKARVEGDVFYAIFSAETGAQIEGHCRYVDDPLALENAPEESLEAPSEERAQSAA